MKKPAGSADAWQSGPGCGMRVESREAYGSGRMLLEVWRHPQTGVLENDPKQPQVCMTRDEGFYPIEDRFCPLVGGGEEGWCVKPPQQSLSGQRVKG